MWAIVTCVLGQREGSSRLGCPAVVLGVDDGAWVRNVASGWVGCADRMYTWESSDSWQVAWAFHECVRSSTLWLRPFTLL